MYLPQFNGFATVARFRNDPHVLLPADRRRQSLENQHMISECMALRNGGRQR